MRNHLFKLHIIGKLCAIVVLLFSMGIGEMEASMANFIEGSYIYFDVTNCTDWANNCTLKMNWFDSQGNSKGDYIGAESYTTNIYRFRIPSDGIGGFQIVRLNPNDHGQQYNYSAKIYAQNRTYDSQNCLCVPSGAVTNNADLSWSIYYPFAYVYDGTEGRVSQVMQSAASNNEHTYVYSWKNWDNVNEKEYGDWRGHEITKTNGVYAFYVTEGRNYIVNSYTSGSDENQSTTLYATSSPSQSHHHGDGTYYWTGGDQAANYSGMGMKIQIVSNAYELYVGENTTFTITAVSPLTDLVGLEIWENGVKLEGTPSGSGTSRTFTYTATSAGIKDISARIHFTFNGQAIYLCASDMRIRVYEKYKIKVQNTKDWDMLRLYMFRSADNNIKNSAWPGIEVTDKIANDGEHDWYYVTLDSKFNKFMLANSDGSKQTYSGGMDFGKSGYEGKCYEINGNADNNNWTTEITCPEYYRLKSTCPSGIYYSNILMGDGTFSLYAQTTKNITLQHLEGNTWTDISSTITSTGISQNGVYTARFNGSNTVDEFTLYEGNYHIHCGATTANYLTNGVGKLGTNGTKFTYFESNALFGEELFNYYWVDWFPTGQTVVATVGNEYNDNLAGILGADEFAPEGVTVTYGGSGSQYEGGNVRFGYNPTTNYFSRTIIAGSGSLIHIQGANVDPNKDGTYNDEGSFRDASVWVYTIEANVKGQATATITTSYNSVDMTLEENQKLIGGLSGTVYTVVITYDFKTNRLLAAWQPDRSIEGFSLESNLMVLRTENGAPTTLNLTSGTLTNISKLYFVMELSQNSWRNSLEYSSRRIDVGSYCDEYYWISLPYDCNINDIFGIEGYGDSWVIQTYHGDYRAEKGWWAETENWWYNLGREDVMKANQGYVLRVTNLDGDHGTTRVFADNSGNNKLYLYFPSAETGLSLGLLGGSTSYTLDSLLCTKWNKERAIKDTIENMGENNPVYDRRAIDSNWRIIGSPSFNTTKITDPTFSTGTYPTSPSGYSLKYFYTWAANTDPKYTITSATNFEFHATHAYLVQYAGTIAWEPSNNSTDPLVGIKKAPAQANEEQSGDQTLRLVLNKDGKQVDVAYISRMAEGATEGYDLNIDLSKLMSKSGDNLYTFAGYYKMAGNCLPDTVSSVPVGVQLAHSGEYTFALPDGSNGIGAVLVDKATDTRTNLGLTDYTVALEAGTYNNRFSLELSPMSPTPTDVKEITGDGTLVEGARKVLMDGTLYIVRDGKVFDARGTRIQ